MIEMLYKDKEVDIQLKFFAPIGKKPVISIYGTGDCNHHLIEGVFDLLDKISMTEDCGHLSKEWKDISNGRIKIRMNELI
jgi:hypothetical protein